MKVYKGIVERTIGHIVEDKGITHGNSTFMFFKDAEYSYKKLHEESNRIANALKEMGIRKGDKVVTILPNLPEYLYIWWGIVKLGAVNVPINNNYRGAGLVDVINRCDAKMAFVHEGLILDRFRAVQGDLELMNQVIVAHSLEGRPSTVEERNIRFNSYSLKDLMLAPADSPGIDVFNYDPASIDYTSGTTGRPKGAVLSHEYMVYFAEHKVMHMETGPQDVIYNCLPMFNLTGEVETCFAAFLADGKFALSEGFNPKTFWDDIRKYNCTEFVSMGGVFSLVEKEPPKPDEADNPLKKMYIIPCRPDFEQRIKKRFNIEHMVEIFGQTESGISAYRDLHNPVLGSAGRAHCDYQIKIFDEHDNEVPSGTEGEIVIRPLKSHIILEEYYKMPDKTAEAMRNCWWHTGDIGKMDENGNLFFIRRKQECIRVRGNFISNTDIEQVVNSHDAILESAVYGVPDNTGEEEDVMVAIKLKEDAILIPEDLLRHVEKNVPYYAVPRYVRFVTDFEKTPTMRIIRVGLQKEGVVPGIWDRRKTGFKLSRK